MSDLKQVVTDFMNNNTSIAEALMHDGDWVHEWTTWDNSVPFEFKGVDSYGGEDCGSDYWTVIEVRLVDNPDETLLVKLQGWYASYNGADYEGWKFVTPQQKTVTVYQ